MVSWNHNAVCKGARTKRAYETWSIPRLGKSQLHIPSRSWSSSLVGVVHLFIGRGHEQRSAKYQQLQRVS